MRRRIAGLVCLSCPPPQIPQTGWVLVGLCFLIVLGQEGEEGVSGVSPGLADGHDLAVSLGGFFL